MRSRSVAAVATISLSLFAASCGGDDPETAAPVPTTSGGVTLPPEATSTDKDSSDDSKSTSGGPATDQSGQSDVPGEVEKNGEDTAGDAIPAAAAKNADLTNLTTALGAADLATTLTQKGPYTVFAPNNDGFAKLGTRLDSLLQPAAKSELANILKFHVVSGELKMKDLKDGDLLTTLQGTRLRVDKKGGELSIGNSQGQARIVSTDLTASNGVIHVIDTVLTPKS